MFTLPPIAAGHCARGNAGAKVHLACVRKVLGACLQGAVGPGSRGCLWIPRAPAIGGNVHGGFRCLVPTGVGVSAFGGTDSGCQCAEIPSAQLLLLTPASPTGPHAHHAGDELERLLKLNWGFYPRCYYQICYHGTPTQNGGAVLYRFAKQV